MTKKTTFLLILCLIYSTFYCQVLKGVYVLKPLKGIGEETTLSEKASKPMIFNYQYSNNKSIAQLISAEKTSIDTTYIEKYNQKFETTHTVRRASSIIYYKNFLNNIYKVLSTRDEGDKSIKEKLPVQNWKMLNESKTINGFSCKKATTTNTAFNSNQKIVAWYCEAIPVNDGPMHYHGLPGFIVQIEIDDLTRATFEKLAYAKDTIIIEEPKNKAKDLSYAELLSQTK
jgi:GLPGLI family protein